MRRGWAPIILALAVAAVWVVVALVPAESIPGPGCQIKEWTGLHCPGCGGTRAARHLVHGRFAEAARSNLLVYPVTAAMAWGLVAFAAKRWGGKSWWGPLQVTTKAMVILLVLAAVFSVVRNLEWAWWLRP